ncbi:hypothetical protein [uncultured Bradyrhizobium sp.]|jgi:hypothetical protein|uniref:hypothetical protein n=1 Tax=uncultured Bradyrhizobium sp. TaxID=199684 RepID=UPI00260D8E98|nr:hypothetical protein [uncultured Bradyrhizobium sp.]
MSERGFEPGSAGGRRGAAPYTLVFMFLLFVPGMVLLLLGRGRGALLPEQLLEFMFPFTVLPFEKQLVLLFGVGGISIGDFDHVNLFEQQFFVLSFLFFFLVMALCTVHAVSSGTYGLVGRPRLSLFLLPIVSCILLREFQINVLIVNLASVRSPNSKGFLALILWRAIAPEALIFATCLISLFIWMLLSMFARSVCERSS